LRASELAGCAGATWQLGHLSCAFEHPGKSIIGRGPGEIARAGYAEILEDDSEAALNHWIVDMMACLDRVG